MTSRDHIYGVLLFAAIILAAASVSRDAVLLRCPAICTTERVSP